MDSIHYLLSEGEKCVHHYYPEIDHIPLYIYGTGGMRLLNDKEVVPMFNYISNEIVHSSYPFSLSIENLSILPGTYSVLFQTKEKKKHDMVGIQ